MASFEVEIDVSAAPGDELFATYGARANDDLAAVYGFVLEKNPVQTFSVYIIETIREGKRTFFKSAPTARSPRAATYDSRLAEKFVDFEEL